MEQPLGREVACGTAGRSLVQITTTTAALFTCRAAHQAWITGAYPGHAAPLTVDRETRGAESAEL